MATSAVRLTAVAAASHVEPAADAFDAAFWPLFLDAFQAAFRVLGDRHAAEDVASEAMARAHLHWNRIAGVPYRNAWVVRVATNRALDVARRRRDPAVERRSSGFEDDAAVRLSVVPALQELPRRQREVVVLRFLVGLPAADVAAVLGIGEGSVRKHMDRGLRRLRARLGDDFGGGGGPCD